MMKTNNPSRTFLVQALQSYGDEYLSDPVIHKSSTSLLSLSTIHNIAFEEAEGVVAEQAGRVAGLMGARRRKIRSFEGKLRASHSQKVSLGGRV